MSLAMIEIKSTSVYIQHYYSMHIPIIVYLIVQYKPACTCLMQNNLCNCHYLVICLTKDIVSLNGTRRFFSIKLTINQRLLLTDR